MPNIVYIATSLDGYIAGPGDDLGWLDAFGASGEDYGFEPFFESIDTMLMGRRTYDVVTNLPHPWPYGSKRTVVLTTQPGISRHGEEFRSGPLPVLLEELHTDGARHVYADGGKVITSLLAENLVDELQIQIMPVLLGAGVRLFGEDFPTRNLELIATKSFASGVLSTHYKLRAD